MIELLNELKNRHSKNINPKEGRHACDNCLSTGINPDSISIYEPCFGCGGHGHLTWIENATQDRRRDVDKETVKICNMNNVIQSLIFLVRSLRKLHLGHVSITVNLEDVKKGTDNETLKQLRHLLECYDLI